MHFRRQDVEFFNNLIPYLYHTKQIRKFGWEFGAMEFQNEVDSVVNANAFDRAKAIAIMRQSLYYWNFEEYLQVFKTIWEINSQCKNPEERIKFLQLNHTYVEKKFQSRDTAVSFPERVVKGFDRTLFNIVDTAVMQKNDKILIYCGLHHAFTRYRTPFLFFKKNGDIRGGEYLYNKYPDKVYMASFCFPSPNKWFLLESAMSDGFPPFVYPFGGVFNQIYDKYQKPFAVDVSNPVFGNIKEYQSWYAFDALSGIQLKDFCDGYIVLNSFSEIEPVHYIEDWVTNEGDLSEVKNTLLPEYAATIKTKEDLLEYMQQQSGRVNIKQWHALPEFWK